LKNLKIFFVNSVERRALKDDGEGMVRSAKVKWSEERAEWSFDRSAKVKWNERNGFLIEVQKLKGAQWNGLLQTVNAKDRCA